MMRHLHNTGIAVVAAVGMFFARGVVYAQEQVTLLSKELPLIGSGSIDADLPSLFNKLLGISVGFSAALAVIILTIGGFKYMTSESMFSMGSAKEQITNAIVGLIIVLSAVLVLSYINPDLVRLRFFAG
jgi:uncharacterized integral membrane protein